MGFSLTSCFKALIDPEEKRKVPKNPEEKTNDALVRDVLLVVATLIAAVTFQAGVNPPGGVWQEGEKAGRAIYASEETPFLIFLICNTLALSSSIFIIICQTWDFPFFLEVVVATVSMLMTYGASIFAVTPRKEDRVKLKFRYLLFIAAAPVVLRAVVQIYKHIMWKRGQRKNVHGTT